MVDEILQPMPGPIDHQASGKLSYILSCKLQVLL
uniref:Uncharacterized protein n=1 Tax=Arundo donax TaxID=35708 RepID=A0A0A8ZGJ2_ARUDO